MPTTPEEETKENGRRAEAHHNFTELAARLTHFIDVEMESHATARRRKQDELQAILEKFNGLAEMYGPALSEEDMALLADYQKMINDAGSLLVRNLKS